MSTIVNLPSLTGFTSPCLTAVLTAKNQADFDSAFDVLFAPHVDVTYNGEHLSRDDYRAQLFSQSSATFEEKVASISIKDQLEVGGQMSGLVGLFYTSIVDYKWLILGAHAESKITSTFNAVIKDIAQPPPGYTGQFFEPRRVVTVNQITSNEVVDVTIPAASIGPNSPGVTVKPGGPIQLGPAKTNA
ncbi:hypothetical protein BDR04DRAFT_1141506 [Suillus decipiens]|nr:hypothetical protein BDR04DRAFT_1141506 [Suillus decipiens]